MLEAGQLCVRMFPWKKWNVKNVNKWNKSYMRTAEMKSSEAWSSQLMYFIYICRISCLSPENREAVSLNHKRYLNSCVRLSLLRCTTLCVRHGLTLTLIKWLLYLMINLRSIHSFNIYSRIASKSWNKMLLILVQYQKLCSPTKYRKVPHSVVHYTF